MAKIMKSQSRNLDSLTPVPQIKADVPEVLKSVREITLEEIVFEPVYYPTSKNQ